MVMGEGAKGRHGTLIRRVLARLVAKQTRYSSMVERKPSKLDVAGSIPAIVKSLSAQAQERGVIPTMRTANLKHPTNRVVEARTAREEKSECTTTPTSPYLSLFGE